MGISSLTGSGPYVATNFRKPPSERKICALVASHNFAALSATVSSTGCRSVGELAITRRISPVAVCCSNASRSSELDASTSAVLCLSSWNKDVLNGDDGLIGEGFEKADLLFSERTDFRAPDHNGPDRDVLTQ